MIISKSLMTLLRTIRLILTFYKSFFIANFIITAVCIDIFWKYGMATFFEIFWFKVISLGMIFYFIREFKAKQFYYYQNLGISKMLLWVTTLTFDFGLFMLLIIMTYKIR